MLEQGAVLALVDEESGLLAAKPIDVELQAVLHGDVVVGVAENEAVLLFKVGFVGKGRLALVVDLLDAAAHDVGERLADVHAVEVHAYAMCLHHGR